MRETFKYFLFRDKLPLYLENGIVKQGNANFQKADGTLASLTYDPEGWDDVLMKYARNIKYLGLFRDMTVPLKFVKDGARIIKNELMQYGIEARLQLVILKFDRMTLPYTYLPWYVGDINFLKYKENKTGTTVEILEGGLTKMLKAYENVVKEIPIDADDEHISVVMDGMELENSAMFAVTEGFDIDNLDTYQVGNHLLDMMVVQKEIEDIGGVFDVRRTKAPNLNTQIRATGKYFFKATAPTVITIEWDFVVTTVYTGPPGINPAAYIELVVREIGEDNISDEKISILLRTQAMGVSGTFHVQGTGTIDMETGDELYLYMFCNVEGAGGDANFAFNYSGDEPFLKMSYTYLHPESLVKHLKPSRVFEKLTDAITEGKYKAQSAFLQHLDTLVAMTSGDALRGIKDSVIKISMTDFFKAINRWGVGLGNENEVLTIERLPRFFTDQIVMSIGEVSDFEIVISEDLLFNTIAHGYKAQEYKEINGRYEFNQGAVRSTPIKSMTKEHDLVSPVRADPFGMELLRINFGGKTTTDTGSDNDTFFTSIIKDGISVNTRASFGDLGIVRLIGQAAIADQFKTGMRIGITGSLLNNGTYTIVSIFPSAGDLYLSVDEAMFNELDVFITLEVIRYILRRPAYSLVEGLLHPGTAFNIELSPVRSLLENGPFIHSVLDNMDGEYLKYSSSDKNSDLKTVLDGVTISERADIQIGSLSPKIFRPFYFNFKTEVPINIQELIKTNPYGLIEFTVNGYKLYGFLFDGGVRPSDNDAQVWKLLSAPNNDLTKINYESF